MDEFRQEDGFIKIDDLTNHTLDKNCNKFTFDYKSKKYFFKKILNVHNIYNELIAEELAKDYKIKCAHYDLANFHGIKGVISDNFINEKEKYISMKEILHNYYKKYNNRNNNLTDIISALEFRYKNAKLVSKLMNQIVNIFIFDVLLANVDRHEENYGIIEKGKSANISPLFDNASILSDLSLLDGGYSLGVDRDDYFFDDYYDPDNKFLMKFLRYSSNEYIELFKSKMWIISEENINKIISRVEKRINCEINEIIKNEIRTNFKINNDNINYVLNLTEERKLK